MPKVDIQSLIVNKLKEAKDHGELTKLSRRSKVSYRYILAVIQGVSRFTGHDSLGDPRWAYAVLGIAAGFEGWSLRTTLRTAGPARGALTWWRLVQVTKAPEIIVVLLEDLGALVGIGIALIGVTLTALTGQREWDAIAAIATVGQPTIASGIRSRETTAITPTTAALTPARNA